MKKTEVIEHFGTAQKVATALGLKSRQAIYLWPDEVPDIYQYRLFQITGGELPLSPHLELPAPSKKPQRVKRL